MEFLVVGCGIRFTDGDYHLVDGECLSIMEVGDMATAIIKPVNGEGDYMAVLRLNPLSTVNGDKVELYTIPPATGE